MTRRHPRPARWLAALVLFALGACAPRSEAPAPAEAEGAEEVGKAGATVGSSGEEMPMSTARGDDSGADDAAAPPLVPPEQVEMDAARLGHVDRLVFGGIARDATPGAALAVGRRGALVRLQGYGHTDWEAGSSAVTASTVYDLASLTKVIGTTTAVMLLVDDGRMDLDAPLADYLPAWGGRSETKDRVTPRHVLTHTAGLPPFKPFWRDLRGREAYLDAIAGLSLEYEPGASTVYSDLGMILLAFAVEHVTDSPVNVFLRERVFEPLGMGDTGYSPLQTGWVTRRAATSADAAEADADGTGAGPVLERIAPTEVDTIFRGSHVHGVVHDENAYAIGGVAGHAGLFSTARDLAVFAQMLLDGGRYGDTRILRPETVRRFTTRQAAGSSRALGWDTPDETSSSGQYFSARSFGHTGFTGTSLWIDPERELFVVFLTNRVNPTRENQRHVELRRAVHDAVQLAVTDELVTPR